MNTIVNPPSRLTFSIQIIFTPPNICFFYIHKRSDGSMYIIQAPKITMRACIIQNFLSIYLDFSPLGCVTKSIIAYILYFTILKYNFYYIITYTFQYLIDTLLIINYILFSFLSTPFYKRQSLEQPPTPKAHPKTVNRVKTIVIQLLPL